MNLKIFTDGGARGNPGPASSAFLVYEKEKVIYKGGEFLGSATNNIAEYKAVLLALTWLKENIEGKGSAEFFIDSELVVKQLNGFYKIKNSSLQLLAGEIKSLEKNLPLEFSYTHIPRSKNKEADALVNKILDDNS